MADYGAIRVKTHSVLKDYIIYWKEKLGSGCNGPVRLCKKKATSERFAVKCLPYCARTRREAIIQISCSNHPHIVTVYDVYVNNIQFPGEPHPKPHLLMIMELMEGGELFSRIKRERRFTEKRAAFYLKQDALVKLTDFGFAKFDNGKLMTPLFTSFYVAPQVLEAYLYQDQIKHGITQISKPCTYDKSCDMWSLGVILYIMLCGYPPFYSETPSRPLSLAMRRKILTGQYEFRKQDWEFISNSAKDIVQSLLRVDPAQRMTVGQLEQTPWLNENAPDTILQSPCIIANKTVHKDIKMVHSDYLSTMRQSVNHVKLKPIEDVTNPIIQKRQLRNESESELTEKHVRTVTKNNTENIKLKALRDIIAYCILPSAVEDDEKTITNLTIRTLYLNNNNTALLDIFKLWDWDGEKFNQKVDHKLLARHLSDLLLLQTSPSQTPLNLSLPLTSTTTTTIAAAAATTDLPQQPDDEDRLSSASPPPTITAITIAAKRTASIPKFVKLHDKSKFTTKNAGTSIRIRRPPSVSGTRAVPTPNDRRGTTGRPKSASCNDSARGNNKGDAGRTCQPDLFEYEDLIHDEGVAATGAEFMFYEADIMPCEADLITYEANLLCYEADLMSYEAETEAEDMFQYGF